MINIAENIKYWMDFTGISFMQILNKTDIKKSTLSNWLNSISEPKPSDLEKMANVMGIEVYNLFRKPNEEPIVTEKDSLIPVLGYADCSKPASTWEESTNRFYDAGDITGMQTPFILLARGDSMLPYINPGDKLLCSDTSFERIKDRQAVVLVYKSPPDTIEANAKLILKKKEHITVYSVNTKYPPQDITFDEIEKIYKLNRIIRDVK